MRLKISINGNKPTGVSVVDADTGVPIKGIAGFRIEGNARGFTKAILTLSHRGELELVGEFQPKQDEESCPA